MASSSRPLCAALIAAAVIAAPARAGATRRPTIYDNGQQYLLGSRAAGMGGAYTALACDEAALHYNPGALGCASSSRLELAANAYVIQRLSVPDAYGAGQDVSATTFHAVPSIVGGVRILSDGEASGAGRWVFGLSVSVPQSIALKIRPVSPTSPNFVSSSIRDDLTIGEIGIGYQVSPELGIGLSIGGALRTVESTSHELLVQPTDLFVNFDHYVNEEEALAIGARAKLGVRWTPIDPLSLGLTVTSPTLHAYGLYEQSITESAAFEGAADAIPDRFRASSEVGLPLRIAIGGAYALPGFTASLDLSLSFPRDIRTAFDLEAIEVEGIQPLTDLEDDVLHRGFQPNANLGVEIALGETKVIDLGLFTDMSAVSDEDRDAGQDRVHMFGGSAALGLLGKQARGWFGVSFSYGRAEAHVQDGQYSLDNPNLFEEDGRSTITRWNLVGIIGSNYSFLSEDAPSAPPAAGAR
ncbi:MAG: hypothetical protein IT372_39555 [Polyangiaceae bacterium]|nr:hypothetical protein [Polyangiaceae bacterium]